MSLFSFRFPSFSTILCEAPLLEKPLLRPGPKHSTDVKKDEETKVIVDLIVTIGFTIVSSLLLGWVVRNFQRQLQDARDGEEDLSPRMVRSKLGRVLARRQTGTRIPHLSSRELQMADQIIDPENIDTSFADIGGLDKTKQKLFELAVLPLLHPDLFSHNHLVEPVKGILVRVD